ERTEPEGRQRGKGRLRAALSPATNTPAPPGPALKHTCSARPRPQTRRRRQAPPTNTPRRQAPPLHPPRGQAVARKRSLRSDPAPSARLVQPSPPCSPAVSPWLWSLTRVAQSRCLLVPSPRTSAREPPLPPPTCGAPLPRGGTRRRAGPYHYWPRPAAPPGPARRGLSAVGRRPPAMAAFARHKALRLARPDPSRKRALDARAAELARLLNARESFCTTSSCDGRVIVTDTDGMGIQKKNCTWLLVTHDPCVKGDVMTALKKATGDAVFKFEPFVLHVLCRELQDAQLLHSVAIDSGFRNSGITVGRGGKITMVSTLLL
uniref:tRNA wybutosine-synthesizing protein 3 homolog n=1 Tax=Zonotrichia albicollis TaxID=44394 RepID=A0A8D2MY58_ZONAL